MPRAPLRTATDPTRQYRRWAFTYIIPETAANIGVAQRLIERLRQVAERWVFQVEAAPTTGRHHIQGRVSFKNGKRLREVATALTCPGAHVEIEHSEAASSFYCTKEESRVLGPWDSKTDLPPTRWPRQIRCIETLHDWQAQFLWLATQWEDRTINVIVDKQGAVGKSTAAGVVEVLRRGKLLPPVGTAKDIIRVVYDIGEYPCYIIDLPRASTSSSSAELWCAIEYVKGGRCFDDRYKWRERFCDAPNIWIFCNTNPPQELLTRDRWRLWTIENGSLCRPGFSWEGRDEWKDCKRLQGLRGVVAAPATTPAGSGGAGGAGADAEDMEGHHDEDDESSRHSVRQRVIRERRERSRSPSPVREGRGRGGSSSSSVPSSTVVDSQESEDRWIDDTIELVRTGAAIIE